MNSFACFLFKKDLITFWFYNPRRGKMAHLHENQVAARALLVLHVSFIDCMIAQIEVSRKSLGGKIEV